MPNYDRTESQYRSIAQIHKPNDPILLTCDAIDSQNDFDDVFSFREDRQSKKRVPTPDFASDYHSTTLESPVNLRLKQQECNVANDKLTQRRTLPAATSMEDEKFFKFRKLMIQQQSPDTSLSSARTLPDTRFKFTSPQQEKSNSRNSYNYELFKFNKLLTPDARPAKRYSHPIELAALCFSPEKKISRSFTIFKQATDVVPKITDNLLEFIHANECRTISNDNRSSIEDDIVSTSSRQKELSQKQVLSGCEFKISLLPTGLDTDLTHNIKSTTQNMTNCESMKYKPLNSKQHNLIEFNSKKSSDLSEDQSKSIDMLASSSKLQPDKRNRVASQIFINRLTWVFKNRLRMYLKRLNDEKQGARSYTHSHSSLILLPHGTEDQKIKSTNSARIIQTRTRTLPIKEDQSL